MRKSAFRDAVFAKAKEVHEEWMRADDDADARRVAPAAASLRWRRTRRHLQHLLKRSLRAVTALGSKKRAGSFH